MKKTNFTADTIVAFKKGRGGRFHNAGYVTFLGEHQIGDFISDLDLTAPSCLNPNNPDAEEEEDFIEDTTPEAEWSDSVGNPCGLTNADIATGIGCIDIDGEYNSRWTMRLGDIDEDSEEWAAIFRDDNCDSFDAMLFLRPELGINTLEELADYINANEEWSFLVNDIIERNLWEDETGEQYGVCSDDDRRIIIDGNDRAIIIDIE